MIIYQQKPGNYHVLYELTEKDGLQDRKLLAVRGDYEDLVVASLNFLPNIYLVREIREWQVAILEGKLLIEQDFYDGLQYYFCEHNPQKARKQSLENDYLIPVLVEEENIAYNIESAKEKRLVALKNNAKYFKKIVNKIETTIKELTNK